MRKLRFKAVKLLAQQTKRDQDSNPGGLMN